MRIEVNRRRARGLASAIAFIVSGCVQISLLVAPVSIAGQERTKPKTPRSDDASFDRPRRIDTQTVIHSSSELGPIIRVALMTDVTSVSLSSSNDLVVHRADKNADDAKKIAGSLRAELRQQVTRSVESVYRVQVATTSESRRARALGDELKRHFFEPVITSFDEKQKDYLVLIGKFETRSDASGLVKRLRAAGYDEPRIVADPLMTSDSAADTNARAAKYKAQPSSAVRAAGKTNNSITQIVVFSADKPTVSSADELIVAPAPGGKVERSDSTKSGDQAETITRTPSVRVDGKDYRGEIHLVLNPRGRINVVNSLPLEEYLRGVVPVELSPGHFPEIEALKAQAVAARSYALARIGRHSDDGFDLVDDTRAQVYGGLSVERELSNRAVDETRGVVAMFRNDEGKPVPIEALYTANCGGRTENNEEVFGGKALPYLRGVACSPDQRSLDGREITTRRTVETLTGIEGRSIARELGFLSVLGFALPRRVTDQYLRNAPDQGELRSWLELLAQLSQKEKPRLPRGDFTRLADFVRLVAVSEYGEGRASTLLAPADVDYLLNGLPVHEVPRDARAEVALLLRDGILHLPGGVVDWRATVTRGQALELVARAVSSKPQPANLKSQVSQLMSAIAASAEKGRLLIANPPASTNETAPRAAGSRYATANTSSRVTRPIQEQAREAKPVKSTAGDPASVARGADVDASSLEIAEDAWLFRKLGDASYAVDRLSLAGGERVTYHLNTAGQVDFLEASVSDRGAASDRFSNIALWQERVAAGDIQQRLTGARINVGKIESIEPVAFSSSSRVTEVEITGDKGHAHIRRPQIRSVLGLKEYLFVVDRETDEQGRLVAFVFTGRGWGHGVGMCQIGAYGLAKEGYSFSAILQKYYTGIKLQKMY
jgi:stage II sporulation protein D